MFGHITQWVITPLLPIINIISKISLKVKFSIFNFGKE
nr:MAG TPA: hypothetical protein [Caudoviricetes sp.]